MFCWFLPPPLSLSQNLKLYRKGAMIYTVTWRVDDDDETPTQLPKSLGINGETFDSLFPFHFVIDNLGKLIQIGKSLSKLIPTLELAQSVRPYISVTEPPECSGGIPFESLKTTHLNSVIMLSCRRFPLSSFFFFFFLPWVIFHLGKQSPNNTHNLYNERTICGPIKEETILGFLWHSNVSYFRRIHKIWFFSFFSSLFSVFFSFLFTYLFFSGLTVADFASHDNSIRTSLFLWNIQEDETQPKQKESKSTTGFLISFLKR